jgi:hypothetical protein
MNCALRYLLTSLAAGAGCALGGVIGFLLLALILGAATRTGDGLGGVALLGTVFGAASGGAVVGGFIWRVTRGRADAAP